MPTQKESQPADLPPMINLGLSAEDAPHTQIRETNPIHRPTPTPFPRNEPNFRIPGVPPPPNHAKRTQSPNADRQKIRNEPNLPHRHPPIDPNMRNEPNFRPDGRNTKD